GPVAQWSFDESSGTTAHDSAGAHDGTLLGDASWLPTAGPDGSGALSLDGAGDGVQGPSDPALEPTSMSITLWLRNNTGETGTWQTLLQKGANLCEAGSYGLQAQEWGITNTGSVWSRTETSTVGNFAGFASPEARLYDGAWHFLAWVYDDSTNTATL